MLRRPVEFTLLSATATSLLLALGQIGGNGALAVGGVSALLLVALALGTAFVRVERRVPEPIVPFALFRDRVIGPAVVSGFLVGIAMFGAISFVPLFVQGALGGTATEAGSALTPLLLGWVLMSIVAGRVMLQVGYRPMVLVGLSCVCAGFFRLAQLDEQSSLWALRAALAIMGVGMGMTMITLILAVQNAVPRELLGTATSFGHFSRSIGGAIGVAVMGAIVVAALPSGQDAQPAEMALALRRVFLFGAGVVAAAVVSAVRFPRGLPQDGRSSSGADGAARVSESDASASRR